MTGIIYARYSSDNQREESIEGQLRECNEFAEKNGIKILDRYVDRAYSALVDKRPAFQQMIKDSHKRVFDIVLVWKLDRFTRNAEDSAIYKAILRRNGVTVVSAMERISDDASGAFLENILVVMSAYYSADLAEKVKRGMTENALKCKYNGGGLPVGYVIDSNQYFQINPLIAPLVLEAFKRYTERGKVKEIVDWLNDKGVQTNRKKPMTINSVNRMLKNRVYIGEYHHGEHIMPGGVPAIVPEDLFDRAQECLAKNKKAPARHKAEDDYLLTTKLYCGHCGVFMVGESGTSHTKLVHHYYKCVTVKKRRNCKKKTVRKNWIEEVVVQYAMQLINNDAVLDNVVREIMAFQRRENTTLPLLRKQFAETQRSIEKMLNAIQQGMFHESMRKRLDELETMRDDLNIRILQEEMQKPLLTEEKILFWLKKFRGLDTTRKDHRQRLIDTLVNGVYLYDDKIVFMFNGKDGSQTVTMDELKQNIGSDFIAGAAPPKTIHKGLPCLGGFLFAFANKKQKLVAYTTSFCVVESSGVEPLTS